MTNTKNYKGFGEVHGLREWARLLDVNKDTLRYWLTTKGLSVEEFAKKNGIEYQPTFDEGRTKVNRAAQAEELLEQLFTRSGLDPELLEKKPVPGKRAIKVYYDGQMVGSYNIDTGALLFANSQEGINLIEYPIDDPKIAFYPSTTGKESDPRLEHPDTWGPHPETRRRVVESIMARNT